MIHGQTLDVIQHTLWPRHYTHAAPPLPSLRQRPLGPAESYPPRRERHSKGRLEPAKLALACDGDVHAGCDTSPPRRRDDACHLIQHVGAHIGNGPGRVNQDDRLQARTARRARIPSPARGRLGPPPVPPAQCTATLKAWRTGASPVPPLTSSRDPPRGGFSSSVLFGVLTSSRMMGACPVAWAVFCQKETMRASL